MGSPGQLPHKEPDIFNPDKSLGGEQLFQGFLAGVTYLTTQLVELELLTIDAGSHLPVLQLLDRIDEAVHEQPEPDADFSVKIGQLLRVGKYQTIQAHLPELDAVATDEGSIIYERVLRKDVQAARWERFLAERAEKQVLARAAMEAERAARPLRRKQVARERADERAKEIAERRRRYLETQLRLETETTERNKVLDSRRRQLIQLQKEAWRKRLPELSEQLAPAEVAVLPHLHRSAKEGAAILDIGEGALAQRVSKAKTKLGLGTREEMALWALERGVQFTVTEPPPLGVFTLRERQVASHLDRKNPDIATELNITNKQVRSDISSLLSKTKAKNRTELALIARLYSFEPFPEELEDNTPEPLKPFSKLEQEVVSRLHLPTDFIVGELGLANEYVVENAINRAAKKVGVPGRAIDLALKLHQAGFQFDILEPKRPLNELLTEKQMTIAQSLDGRLGEEIAKQHGIETEQLWKLVHYMQTKAGARSKIEFILMVRTSDPGKSRPEHYNVRPREERFFEALGIEPMPMEAARPLLKHAAPRQREYLEAYYFSERKISWKEVSEQLHVTRETAVTAGNRALARIRSQLEANNPSS